MVGGKECTIGEYNHKKMLKIHSFIQTSSALTYFHPTLEPQRVQNISATVCSPVIIILSSFSPTVTFALHKEIHKCGGDIFKF
ncbi:hypothetical protein ACJIZ3_009585 [Penstemon smallii]|uniref:Uncharacterized protein n=1 Tax=Penstemon smallii TaxID=265156 RepID=A0ABD3TCY2_9LAMI